MNDYRLNPKMGFSLSSKRVIMEQKNIHGVEAEGFLFLNGADASLAEKEKKQIEYLNKKLDYQKPEQILQVMQTLINERTFKTPVGVLYLKQLQDFLLNNKTIEKERIPFVPVDYVCDPTAPEKRVELKSVRQVARRREEIQKSNHRISIILNVVLTIAIILMFWLATRSDTMNMINYKTVLENRYAEWEQELMEREQEIREKEQKRNQ